MNKLTIEDATNIVTKPLGIEGVAGFSAGTEPHTIIHGAHLADAFRWRDPNTEPPISGNRYMLRMFSNLSQPYLKGETITKTVEVLCVNEHWIYEGYYDNAIETANTHYRPFIEGIDCP